MTSPRLKLVSDGHGRGGAFLADLQQVEVLPIEYNSRSYYNGRLKIGPWVLSSFGNKWP